MSAYSLALFLHLLSMLLATVATALAGFAAFRLRDSENPREAAGWGMLIGKVVRAFPVATIGLVATGAYMTQKEWSWSSGWIIAGLAGLALIVVCGAGIEGSRGRALKRELQTAGLSARAQQLMRDPLSWSAKVTTWTLTLAVVFVMSTKPSGAGAAAALAVAVGLGVAGAVLFWRRPLPRERTAALSVERAEA